MIDEQTLKEINTCPLAKNKKEEYYIFRRKIKAFLNSVCFYLCRIFPIKKNLISVCTFEGKGGFGCNPKYIVQELHKQHPEYEFVWFVNKDIFDKKEFPDYIRKVTNTMWSRAYWLTRSKVWIDNYRKPYGTVKRKKQFYINTWHGTIGIKSTGLLRGDGFSKMAYLVSVNDSKMIDKIVIDSEWCEQMTPRALVYTGNYLKVGSPRCDILHNKNGISRNVFCKKYNVDKEARFLLFVPTYREYNSNGKRDVFSEVWSINFERMINALETRDGCKWYVCMRVHPQISAKFNQLDIFNRPKWMIDLSLEDDIYQYLNIMNTVVTDYSSLAMDACFGGIPVFIYADDIENYVKSRGSVLWDFSKRTTKSIYNNMEAIPGLKVKFPFDIAVNNDELENMIKEFNMADYYERVVRFNKEVGLIFDGQASKRVVEYILKVAER